ncbi:MAG: polyprenyl synthetase family protein [Planctomycetota bacterium]
MSPPTPLTLTPTDPTGSPIDAALADRLETIEARFAAELHSDLDCVNELVGHVERYRGKMLRPMLTVLSAMCLDAGGGPRRSEVDLLATVLEMVHMSTLVHDDVLDEADVRRRGQTINRLQGNEAAVMLGDYLISHSYHLCCNLGADVAKAVAAATNTVCEGELLQLSHRGDLGLSARTYFEIVKRKTAALTAACCAVPVMLLGGGPLRGVSSASEARDALHVYGEKVGVAFQIIDDVLDLVGDEEVVGKSLGRDLAKGKLTLPLILWLEGLAVGGEAELERGRAALRDAAAGGATATLRAEVRASGAIDRAYQRAGVLIQDAKATLTASIPGSDARARLEQLADATLARRR